MATKSTSTTTTAPAKKAAARPAAAKRKATDTTDTTVDAGKEPATDETSAEDRPLQDVVDENLREIADAVTVIKSGTPEAHDAIVKAQADPEHYVVTSSSSGSLSDAKNITHILKVADPLDPQPGDRVLNAYIDPRTGNQLTTVVRAEQIDIVEYAS